MWYSFLMQVKFDGKEPTIYRNIYYLLNFYSIVFKLLMIDKISFCFFLIIRLFTIFKDKIYIKDKYLVIYTYVQTREKNVERKPSAGRKPPLQNY